MRSRNFWVMAVTAALAMTISDPARAASSVAVWHMDDVGSIMTDSSGNGLQGTLKNVVTRQPGFSGTAFMFRGTPSVVTVPHNTKLNPGSGIFTATLRVRFSAVPSNAVGDYDLIRKGLAGTAGGEWKMEILRSGKAYCLFHGSGGRLAFSAGPNLANNAWHAISCQRSGNQLRLTVDGVTFTKAGPTGTIANTSTTFVGAKSSSGGDQYSGLIDEVVLAVG